MIAATTELIEHDLEGKTALAEVLSVTVPGNWPPELYESTAMRVAHDQLQDPTAHGWSIWYLLSRRQEVHRVMGICGFKGKPDEKGSVEIGYSVLRQFHAQGYATEAVARLVVWAFSHQYVIEVTAETLPHLKQSIRVMEKNGLTYAGPGSEYGVVKYALQKTHHR